MNAMTLRETCRVQRGRAAPGKSAWANWITCPPCARPRLSTDGERLPGGLTSSAAKARPKELKASKRTCRFLASDITL